MESWLPTITQGTRPQPLYQAIADAIVADIAAGTLTPGDRLPTHRALADALGTTVGTVTRGYAVAKQLGWIDAKVGRGTFVTDRRRPQPKLIVSEHEEDDPTRPIELGINSPLHHADPDLGPTLKAIAADAKLARLLRYNPASGTARYREAGARWFVDQYELPPPDTSCIHITAGAQHALTVALCALSRPQDTVLTEALTSPGLMALARLLGRSLHPIPIDEQGLLPDALDAACAQTRARFLYCIPDLHSPTTACMGKARRQAIVSVARRHGLTIIEDAIHTPLIARQRPPTLYALAPERTVLIASLSKVLAGGLRIAYTLAPKAHAIALERAITNTMWMVPPLMAEVATRWVLDGTAARTVALKRAQAEQRQAKAAAILEGFRYQTYPSAYNLWLHLPEPWRSATFVEQAAHRGVSLTPTEAFVVGRGSTPFALRLSLCAPETMASLVVGLERVRALLEEPEGHAPVV